MSAMTDSVTVQVNAPPAAVWALVSDVTRIGEFSPETLEGRWVGEARGPAVGAKFQGHVKRNGRGPMYWTTCTVIACEPEREFAFAVGIPGVKAVNTWRYRLFPHADGTQVTESYELTDTPWIRAYWRLAGRARNRTNVAGMRATLERIKAVAEAPA